jgi:DNA-binding transcriptional ArsR family regulator
MFHICVEHDGAQAMAAVGQQLGHPLRIRLLSHVANAGPCPFSELVEAVDGTTAQVSNHLKSLRDAGLLTTQRQGRQSLYRVPNAHVAELLANIAAAVDPDGPTFTMSNHPHSEARRCYDHIGGRLGVEILRALHRSDGLTGQVADHEALDAGPAAAEVLPRFGVGDWEQLLGGRRRFAYGCPDWTERTPHLGGAAAAVIMRHMQANGWLHQRWGSRSLTISQQGHEALQWMGVAL